MRKDLKAGVWNTDDEIDFINGLGTHFAALSDWAGDLTPEVKLRLLNQYKSVMPLRVDWGNIQPSIIADYVDKLIDKIGRRYNA